jgi:hypothetical protein
VEPTTAAAAAEGAAGAVGGDEDGEPQALVGPAGSRKRRLAGTRTKVAEGGAANEATSRREAEREGGAGHDRRRKVK